MARARWTLVLSLAFALGLTPVAASAAVLTLSGGTLSFQFGFLPAPTVDQGPAVPVLVSSGGGGFTLPASAFAGQGSTQTPTNSLFSTINVTVTNAAGSFAPGGGPGGGFGGAAALSGRVVLGILGGLINVSIPLSPVGGGGFVTSSTLIPPGSVPIEVSVTGHVWTTGSARVTGLAFLTFPTPSSRVWVNTVTVSGADNRTAGHMGLLTLVTPFRVSSNTFGVSFAFATQVLTFVPEPGALVLLLFAAGLAVLVGRSRR